MVDQAAGLLKDIGLASHHVILIGGIVPGLLVPILDPGIEPHIGTTDLDFCLSVALVEGDTAQYERIEQGLKRAGFMSVESWRWRGGPGNRLLVEFFCPAGPNRWPATCFGRARTSSRLRMEPWRKARRTRSGCRRPDQRGRSACPARGRTTGRSRATDRGSSRHRYRSLPRRKGGGAAWARQAKGRL